MRKWFSWFNSWNQNEEVPGFWKDYLADCADAVDLDTPLDKIPFVVFDTETTGLNVKNDQILSIGAVRLQGWEIKVEESLDFFVHQVYEPVKSTVEIHGIVPKDREDSLEEVQAIRCFLEFIKNSVLVGHHVAFDVAMINAALNEIVGGKLCNTSIDTIRLARRLMPPSPLTPSVSLTLDELCRQYNISLNDRHTAAGDAFLTALLFLKLMRRLQKRGVHTLRDLRRRRY